MNRFYAIVAISLSLTACGHALRKGDLPASDLDSLNLGVSSALQERRLENGHGYCLEFAKTTREQEECAADLEDLVFLMRHDEKDALKFVQDYVARGTKLRKPCKFWQRC